MHVLQDIGDQMEKRVKSRFSSNYIAVYNKLSLGEVCALTWEHTAPICYFQMRIVCLRMSEGGKNTYIMINIVKLMPRKTGYTKVYNCLVLSSSNLRRRTHSPSHPPVNTYPRVKSGGGMKQSRYVFITNPAKHPHSFS
jgi:hypothetical protein